MRTSSAHGSLGLLSVLSRAREYAGRFSRLIKFEHSVFALPFAYAGALLAETRVPGFSRLVWITVAMVSARSMAMALNRLLDARIDALNPRTRTREIPSGLLKRWQVWSFVGLCLAVLVISTFRLPEITRYLWPLIVIPFVVYPLTKRWTWACHLFLGGTIGLGPVGAWVAVTGVVAWQPFLLWGAVMLWIGGFDVIYAMMDVQVDREQGIHSIPADFGYSAALWCTRMCHLGAVALLAAIGAILDLGLVYHVGVVVCAGLLFYENYLMRKADLAKVGVAFMTMNGIISCVYLVFTASAVLLLDRV